MTTASDRGRAVSWALWFSAVVIIGALAAATAWAGLNHPASRLDAVEGQAFVAAEPDSEAPAPAAGLALAQGGPWTPGTTFHLTDAYPSPGVPFTVTECTATFSFSDAEGRAYAVTAGHCGEAGDLVWPTTASTATDFAVEVGRVIYTDLTLNADVYHDVGLIEITDAARPMTFAGSAEQAAELLVGEPARLEGERVCKIGGTTEVTCGVAGGQERQQLHVDDGGFAVTEGRTAALCAARGDSGGPVTATIDGRSVIVGLVSGTRVDGAPVTDCADPAAAGMTLSYTPTSTIVDILADVVPEAQLARS